MDAKFDEIVKDYNTTPCTRKPLKKKFIKTLEKHGFTVGDAELKIGDRYIHLNVFFNGLEWSGSAPVSKNEDVPVKIIVNTLIKRLENNP